MTGGAGSPDRGANGIALTDDEKWRLIDPAAYHRHGYPWEIWKKLREASPVHWVEQPDGDNFWAITRYQDIMDVERNTDVFRNAPRLIMAPQDDTPRRMIVNMDPPDHTAHRAFAAPHFMPRAIDWVRQSAEDLVTEALDKVMARNGEIVDLQEDVANLVPTAVISAYLGAPRERWNEIVHLTNQVISSRDPSLAASAGGARDVMAQAAGQIFAIHGQTLADRRANPRDDFMTGLAQAQINGQPMNEIEQLSWAFILTTAGHETTQSTFTLGVQALMEHPAQLAKLRADLSLLPRAIEELLRYISPAIHFVRTAARDFEFRGRMIREGDNLVLFFPSGNRDAATFANPDALDIERWPNRHIAFGSGPHLCIGMHLARLELKVMFEHFLRRVETIEPAGTPERVYTNNTGGYVHYPVRMKVLPRA